MKVLTVPLVLCAGLVPALSQWVPRADHIVVVIEENKSRDQIIAPDNPNAPYLNQLAHKGAVLMDMRAEFHPSQPNYVQLFSGSNHGIVSDLTIDDTDRFYDYCLGGWVGMNEANVSQPYSFMAFSEGLPAPGSLIDFEPKNGHAYARKHCPWTNFLYVPQEEQRSFADFPANFDSLPRLAFVIPNQDHDMHEDVKPPADLGGVSNGSIYAGDQWLQNNIAAYADYAMKSNSLLMITWDEDNTAKLDPNRIPTLIVGQHVKPCTVSERLNHNDLLEMIEMALRIPLFGESERAAGVPAYIWQ